MATGRKEEVYVSPIWWGFSPALDLQMHCPQSTIQHLKSSDNIPELNILLVGDGDFRHILKTICQAQRWPQRKLNFYVIESDLELLARHMLFLTLALENPEKMGLQEKSETFLELFGNSLVRSQTATYLQEKCNLFIRFVTDPDFQESIMPSLDLTVLKHKEKDELEDIFKYWQTPEPKLFPIIRYWDVKNRQYLGRRYDSRKGAYDWDLSMKLHERGAGVIHAKEYYRWREKGVAFILREGIYDVPNKTLTSHMMVTHINGKVRARGYWGDITTSPYIAFGIETEEKSLLKTANGVHVKCAQEISLYNITALFSELVTGQKYTLPASVEPDVAISCNSSPQPENSTDGGVTESSNGLTSKENTNTNGFTTEENKSHSASYKEFITLNNVKIHFLPFSWVNQLHRKSRFNNFFNMIYFSCGTIHLLEPEYKLITARKAIILIELTKFMVDLQTEKVKSYVTIVTKVAKEAGFTSSETVDWKREHVASFERMDDVETLQHGE
ncbi:dynein axonemal assembly factor 3 [Discoglossus pictus]